MYGGEERCLQFWWRRLRKIHNLEDPSVDRRIILKRFIKKWNRGMDWNDRGQDRGRWLALVNVVMTFGFHKMRIISRQSRGRVRKDHR